MIKGHLNVFTFPMNNECAVEFFTMVHITQAASCPGCRRVEHLAEDYNCPVTKCVFDMNVSDVTETYCPCDRFSSNLVSFPIEALNIMLQLESSAVMPP